MERTVSADIDLDLLKEKLQEACEEAVSQVSRMAFNTYVNLCPVGPNQDVLNGINEMEMSSISGGAEGGIEFLDEDGTYYSNYGRSAGIPDEKGHVKLPPEEVIEEFSYYGGDPYAIATSIAQEGTRATLWIERGDDQVNAAIDAIIDAVFDEALAGL